MAFRECASTRRPASTSSRIAASATARHAESAGQRKRASAFRRRRVAARPVAARPRQARQARTRRGGMDASDVSSPKAVSGPASAGRVFLFAGAYRLAAYAETRLRTSRLCLTSASHAANAAARRASSASAARAARTTARHLRHARADPAARAKASARRRAKRARRGARVSRACARHDPSAPRQNAANCASSSARAASARAKQPENTRRSVAARAANVAQRFRDSTSASGRRARLKARIEARLRRRASCSSASAFCCARTPRIRREVSWLSASASCCARNPFSSLTTRRIARSARDAVTRARIRRATPSASHGCGCAASGDVADNANSSISGASRPRFTENRDAPPSVRALCGVLCFWRRGRTRYRERGVAAATDPGDGSVLRRLRFAAAAAASRRAARRRAAAREASAAALRAAARRVACGSTTNRAGDSANRSTEKSESPPGVCGAGSNVNVSSSAARGGAGVSFAAKLPDGSAESDSLFSAAAASSSSAASTALRFEPGACMASNATRSRTKEVLSGSSRTNAGTAPLERNRETAADRRRPRRREGRKNDATRRRPVSPPATAAPPSPPLPATNEPNALNEPAEATASNATSRDTLVE